MNNSHCYIAELSTGRLRVMTCVDVNFCMFGEEVDVWNSDVIELLQTNVSPSLMVDDDT